MLNLKLQPRVSKAPKSSILLKLKLLKDNNNKCFTYSSNKYFYKNYFKRKNTQATINIATIKGNSNPKLTKFINLPLERDESLASNKDKKNSYRLL